jgi:hypothetical protein
MWETATDGMRVTAYLYDCATFPMRQIRPPSAVMDPLRDRRVRARAGQVRAHDRRQNRDKGHTALRAGHAGPAPATTLPAVWRGPHLQAPERWRKRRPGGRIPGRQEKMTWQAPSRRVASYPARSGHLHRTTQRPCPPRRRRPYRAERRMDRSAPLYGPGNPRRLQERQEHHRNKREWRDSRSYWCSNRHRSRGGILIHHLLGRDPSTEDASAR